MTPAVSISGMRAQFRLPAGKELNRGPDHTLVSEAAPTVRVFVDRNALTVEFWPPLKFVIHPEGGGPLRHLVEDVHWRGVTYLFRQPTRPVLSQAERNARARARAQGDGRSRTPAQSQARAAGSPRGVRANIERIPLWLAVDLASDTVRNTVEHAIEDLMADLAFAGPTYDPLTDPNLEANFRALAERLSGGGDASSGAEMLRGFGATVVLEDGFREVDGSTRIELSARTRISADVTATASTRPGLIAVTSAEFTFDPPLVASSDDDTFEVRRATVTVTPDRGPVVELSEAQHKRMGGGASIVYLLALAGGALVGASQTNGSRVGALMGAERGMAGGQHIVLTLVGQLATRGVVAALEKLRPALKEAAPLIDWDGLLRDRTGRPVLQRPVSGGR